MTTCFVPKCKSGAKIKGKRINARFFRPPKDEKQLAIWQRAIPRADKPLTRTCRVCHVHFDESFIQKYYTHLINGETVCIERGCWRLTDDAVPSIFPNLPHYLSKIIKKRKPPAVRPFVPKKRKTIIENTEENRNGNATEENQNKDDKIPHELTFNELMLQRNEIALPKTSWAASTVNGQYDNILSIVFSEHVKDYDGIRLRKVFEVTNSMVPNLYINGRKIEQMPGLPETIDSMEKIQFLLACLSGLIACEGSRPNLTYTKSIRNGIEKNGQWFSVDCQQIVDNAQKLKMQCKPCIKLSSQLRANEYRKKKWHEARQPLKPVVVEAVRQPLPDKIPLEQEH